MGGVVQDILSKKSGVHYRSSCVLHGMSQIYNKRRTVHQAPMGLQRIAPYAGIQDAVIAREDAPDAAVVAAW